MYLGFKKSVRTIRPFQSRTEQTSEIARRAQCCSLGTPPIFVKISKALSLTASSSFFKTLVDHEVTVELKNDISIKGVLKSVDQFLNIKLDDIQVVEELKYPHLVSPAAPPLWSSSK